jgi:hypothetical protein
MIDHGQQKKDSKGERLVTNYFFDYSFDILSMIWFSI